MPRIGGILDITDVVPEGRVITTTAPLTGGGDLSVDRDLGITVGPGGVAANNDARLNDARPWVLYGGGAPTGGQALVWDAATTKYVPGAASGGSVDAEAVRDIIGTTLVPGTNVSIAVDDPGDTVTISATGAGGSTSDATTSAKGIIQLAGDLAGTAAAPTVPGAQKTVQKSTVATPVANGYIGADAAGLTPTALLPAASTTAPGIVQLAGDLGGSSSAPVIVRRGPVGGFTQVTYAATVTINAATGNDFYVVATGNLALAAPTGGVDGQQLFIEVYASGGSRTVSFTGTTTFVAGIGTTLVAATGKVGFIGMRYSARSGTPHWVVHAMAAEV